MTPRSRPPTWEVRVKRSRAHGRDSVAVICEHLYEDLFIYHQPAEIVVGDLVKRIDYVHDRARRKEVPGEAYLILHGITVHNFPINALIRGPAR